MSKDNPAPENLEVQKKTELRRYVIGFISCAALTILAFAAVVGDMGRPAVIWLLAGAALAQLIIQLRFFMHVDHSKQAREDLQLILFSTLIMVIMMFGTIWVMGSLTSRMWYGM